MEYPALPAGLAQQPIAGVACRFLKAGLRLGAGPAQDEAFDSVPLQHAGRRERFPCRLRSQSVIHDQRKNVAALPGRPFARQQGEAERISAAGNGDREVGT